MSNPKVRCNQCGGTGFRHLPKKLKASLEIAEKLSAAGPFLVSEFQKSYNKLYTVNGLKPDLKLDAAHHRISRLLDLGMVKRDGKKNPARYMVLQKEVPRC